MSFPLLDAETPFAMVGKKILHQMNESLRKYEERIAELEAELSAIRATRMNCVRDGKCQHCGVEAPYCYHPTWEDYVNAMKRVAELELGDYHGIAHKAG